MYALVADVEAYPQFLPWCRSVEVHYRDADTVEASMELARGPLRKFLTTRNRMQPSEAIDIELVRGPFRRLEGRWRFDDEGSEGSRVSLEMQFDVANLLLRKTLGPLFGEISATLVEAFCRRAAAIHDS